jgi:hypothetical protein
VRLEVARSLTLLPAAVWPAAALERPRYSPQGIRRALAAWSADGIRSCRIAAPVVLCADVAAR